MTTTYADWQLELANAVPGYTLESLEAYARTGRPTGGFLYAVLTNNLFGAYGKADRQNLAALEAIVRYVYNVMPADSWGSGQVVEAWIERGGLNGREAA